MFSQAVSAALGDWAADTADFAARNMYTKSEALQLVNGFSATPLMELYLIYNTAAKLFTQHGIKVAKSLVGNYTTALDMAGASNHAVPAR